MSTSWRNRPVKPYTRTLASTIVVCLLAMWWVLGGPDWLLAAWITGGALGYIGYVSGREVGHGESADALRAARREIARLRTQLNKSGAAYASLAIRAEKAERTAAFNADLAASHLAELNRYRAGAES